MQSPPDDQPNPPDRPGTPPRPPYSPVTPVLSHLAPVPNNNNTSTNGVGFGFPASSAPFSASPSHPIVPPARSPSPTARFAPPNLPTFNSNSNSNSTSHADIAFASASAAPLPPTPSFPASTSITATASTPTSQTHQHQTQHQTHQQAIFAPEPTPLPISESSNPDAIALRSAISILQMQKQQSLRDLRTLERLKRVAAADPETFARELAAGNLSAKKEAGGFLNLGREDEDEEDEDGDEREEEGAEGARGGSRARLGTIPTPQNVVRMPPVNWAKYQIVGDPLDRMHEDQRRRPVSGEPRREEPVQRAPEHVLASPYRPLVDKLETPTKVKGASKSKKT